MDNRAAQALIRFGLGRRGAQALPADPQGWLRAQLFGPDPALRQDVPPSGTVLAALRSDLKLRPPPQDRLTPPLVKAAVGLAMDNLVETEVPFRERLVWFWANHFTVSRHAGTVGTIAYSYVCEAIRPHVTGRFVDMLLAVMHHPAMLIYLDNQGSMGPDSRLGRRLGRGLNENLARECLELHTVTPASGYSQADVTAFSRVLTGWSVNYREAAPGFLFRPAAHEPGRQHVMGRDWPAGYEGGRAMLEWLGQHPATMRSLAEKLVRHFVADHPPEAAVAHVEQALRRTGGDLRAAALAVLECPQAWQPLTKLRTPFDYSVAVLRALDLPAAQRPKLAGVMALLGQPFMTAPLPNGWPDTAADWAAPAMMMRRIDWAAAVARRAGTREPRLLAEDTLGPLLPADSMRLITRAGSRHEALAMLFATPQFQRR